MSSIIVDHATRLAALQRSRAAAGLETAELERTLATLAMHTGIPYEPNNAITGRHAALLFLDGILAELPPGAEGPPDARIIRERINARVREANVVPDEADQLKLIKDWPKTVRAEDIFHLFTTTEYPIPGTRLPRVEAYLTWLFLDTPSPTLTMAGGRNDMEDMLMALAEGGRSAVPLLERILRKLRAEPRTRKWLDENTPDRRADIGAVILGIARSDDPVAQAWLFTHVDMWRRERELLRAIDRAIDRNTPASFATVRTFADRVRGEFSASIIFSIRTAVRENNMVVLRWIFETFPDAVKERISIANIAETLEYELERRNTPVDILEFLMSRYATIPAQRTVLVARDLARIAFIHDPTSDTTNWLLLKGFVNVPALANAEPAYVDAVLQRTPAVILPRNYALFVAIAGNRNDVSAQLQRLFDQLNEYEDNEVRQTSMPTLNQFLDLANVASNNANFAKLRELAVLSSQDSATKRLKTRGQDRGQAPGPP